MSRVIYSNAPRVSTSRLICPYKILQDLLKNRELIVTCTKQEFRAANRGTYFGMAWTIISPLIMLALFTLVFGYIFGGRFSPDPNETRAEFALALFVGLGFFNCLAQSMGASPSMMLANSTYVKTLAFPLEILPVSAVLNVMLNLAISLGLCLVIFVVMHGYVHLSAVCLILHAVCVTLLSLGASWFLSSLAVFVRDVSLMVPPLTLIIMFSSSLFYPLSMVPPHIRPVVELNPLAIIIEQARSCFLYGQWPDFLMLAIVTIFSLSTAVMGYCFFMKTKPAFADVI